VLEQVGASPERRLLCLHGRREIEQRLPSDHSMNWTESIPLIEARAGDFCLSHLPSRCTALRGRIDQVVVSPKGKILGIVVKRKRGQCIAVGAEHVTKCWGYR
jgi:hypothetical protein